jgi:hypothetical protein
MKSFIYPIIFFALCIPVHAQIGFNIKTHAGHSVLSKKTLIPVTWVYGLSSELHLGDESATVVAGFGMLRMLTKSDYLKPLRLNYISFGFNFIPKSGSSNLQFGTSILLSKSTLVPDSDRLPDSFADLNRTFWNQLGANFSCNYLVNKRFGLTSCLTHSFARKFDNTNRQTFLTLGCVFRLLHHASNVHKV